MELNKISELIAARIRRLEEVRNEIAEKGEAYSMALADYEKELGLTMLKLENGAITEHEGFSCEKIGKTNMEKIARSICWNYRLQMETAEKDYKACLVIIDALKAELTGYQSLYKNQEEI